MPSTKAQHKRARERKKAAQVATATVPGVMEPGTREAAQQEVVAGTDMTVAQVQEMKLITDPAEIARLAPEDLRKQLLARAAVDSAAADLARREAESGTVQMRPEIMRRTDEKAGRVLLNQLDHVLASAGATRAVAANPTAANLKKYIPVEEVEQMRETLAGIPESRDKKASADREREAKKSHVNGTAIWQCENYDREGKSCGRFRGAALEVVRRKAAAEPGWIFACPVCRGTRVRLADMQEVA